MPPSDTAPFVVQALGMHAQADELVAQALGEALWLIGWGIWHGRQASLRADGNEQDQALKCFVMVVLRSAYAESASSYQY